LQRISQAEDLHDTQTPTGPTVPAQLPLTAQALAKGALGPGHVEVIQKALKGLEPSVRQYAERLLVDQANDDDPNALSRFAAVVRDRVDPDGDPPDDREPRKTEREFTRHTRRDGTMTFRGKLDPETGVLLEELLKPFEKPLPKEEGPDPRSYAERAGDALADVLQMAANCPDLPTHNGMKAEMTLMVSLETLESELGHALFSVSDARRIACDAHVIPAVMGGPSKPLDIAVPEYVVPAHIRRALVLRDRGCVFPGCAKPASVCHSHHVKSWLDGSQTELGNLVLLCGHHHRLIHNSDWEIELVNGTAQVYPPAYVDPERRPRVNLIHRRNQVVSGRSCPR
jgi:hypothetical protein